jgi:hypothetical protein
MRGVSRLRAALELLKTAAAQPFRSAQLVARTPDALRAERFSRSLPMPSGPSAETASNPLRAYFDAHTEGRGIWKWHHYFDLYHRHLAKFMGSDAHVVEIGVFSGGSLGMWREYLGPRGRVTGVDIAPECKAYEDAQTRIWIGDQSDRAFWARFRAENPRVDVLIDDGGHQPEQQRITLEEMLPHLAPGGVYICEDIHGRGSHFAAFTHALADQLNDSAMSRDTQAFTTSRASPLQAAVASIHFYPYAVVIERTSGVREQLVSERRGTEWQPFL